MVLLAAAAQATVKLYSVSPSVSDPPIVLRRKLAGHKERWHGEQIDF